LFVNVEITNDQDPDGTRMDMGANLDRHFSVMHGRISFLSSGKSVTDVTITSSSLIQKQADDAEFVSAGDAIL